MTDILSNSTNFASLSIRDLLQARDLYHYHLLNKPNVVGTAIGLYLIRKNEPEPEAIIRRSGARKQTSRKKGERTLWNSEVREYSWPCVHAFVREWFTESEFGGSGRLHPEAMVPKTLYMPDGRMVPVCVTKVDQGESEKSTPGSQWPGGRFGAGMPIYVATQERQRMATAGCLVTDGHKIYVLTNRHVCGDSDEPVFTLARGRFTQIGTGSNRRLTRVQFTEVYSDFSGLRTFLNMDVGLIEVNDANEWSSSNVVLGDIGELADLNESNISLRLIDAPVVAAGAASGRIEGKIKALFYRYRSVGGYDYVSDFLIAPGIDQEQSPTKQSKQPNVQTRPGDSGAVWHLVNQETSRDKNGKNLKREVLRPIGVEWGGQVFLQGDTTGRFSFGLATSLASVCRTLDVELLTDHNIGAAPYWGQMGHYSIATFACGALVSTKLSKFFKDNLNQISFDPDDLSPKGISERVKKDDELIPLADVPDLLWKQHYSKTKGGRDTRWAGKGRSTGPEHPTHYADIDEPRDSDNKTLRQLCLENDDNISPSFWQQFYDDNGHTEERSRGLLPFRVWQFFDAMVQFAKARQMDKFLCAAGILSHYVGDACQPLHGSMYADGYPDQKREITHHKRDTGEEYTEESHVGAGVHSTYETKMIDRYAPQLVPDLMTAAKKGQIPTVNSGKDAAKAVIKLMDRTAAKIPPTKLVDAFVDAGGKPNVSVQDALWEQFGTATVQVMADGARVLAGIWEGAWRCANGAGIPQSKLGRVDPDKLISLYEDTDFVKSLDLDQIASILRGTD